MPSKRNDSEIINSAGGGGGFTNPMTSSGDLIKGGIAGAATRLPKGTEGYRLSIVSGTPAWVAPAAGANGFVDTFIDVVSNDGAQTLPATNYSFDKILMPNVISDIYGNYNPATSEYTVPTSGVYQITGSFRAENSKQAGTTFGVGVHSSLTDGAWFLWHAVQTTTNVYNRTTYPYIRVGLFTAGQTLKMFSFVDGTSMKVQLAGMQIIRIA